jgi:ring-1,2-phenylacetyl-CoA epoxidase subunit PaaE
MKNRIKLRVTDKIQETDSAVTLQFEPVDGKLDYEAGQFLTFLFDELDAQPFRRSYSFCSAPQVDDFVAVTVKRVPNGVASRYLTQYARVGDELESLLPAGQFTLPPSPGKPRDIFLIGGGSGITPLFSILKFALKFEPDSHLTLINANSNENAIIFREQLRALAKQYPKQLTVIHLLSTHFDDLANLRQAEAPAEVRIQRLGNALVQRLIEQHLKYEKEDAQFFLCGPKNLMLKASMMLHFMQFPEERIHQEVFTITTPFRPPSEKYNDSFVNIRYHETDFHIPVKGGQTILEAAEALGIELPFSCRSGICTTCAGQCTAGRVEMFPQAGQLTTDDSEGVVFTCVGYPLTPTVNIDLDI